MVVLFIKLAAGALIAGELFAFGLKRIARGKKDEDSARVTSGWVLIIGAIVIDIILVVYGISEGTKLV